MATELTVLRDPLTVKIYRYPELDEKVKEKLREKYIEWDDQPDEEQLKDSFVYELTRAGYVSGHVVPRSKTRRVRYKEQGKWKWYDYSDWMDFADNNAIVVHYSLGYCQGDGVGFYGTIQDKRHLRALCKRIMDHGPERQAVLWYIDHDRLLLDITGEDSRYHHESSMYIDLQVLDPDGNELDYLNKSVPITAWSAITNFERAIKDDMKEMSWKLRDMGYKEIEYFRSDEVVDEALTERYDWYYGNGNSVPTDMQPRNTGNDREDPEEWTVNLKHHTVGS